MTLEVWLGQHKRGRILMDLAEFPNATCVPIFKYGIEDIRCSMKSIHSSIFKNMAQFLSAAEVKDCVPVFKYSIDDICCSMKSIYILVFSRRG